MKNDPLVQILLQNTGLPKNLIEKEWDRLSAKYYLERENLSMDDLREILAEYLQDTFIKLRDSGA